MDKSELTDDLRAPDEIKAACVESVRRMGWRNEVHDTPDDCDLEAMVSAVLTSIIAHSQSPRTVSELSLIRGPVQ